MNLSFILPIMGTISTAIFAHKYYKLKKLARICPDFDCLTKLALKQDTLSLKRFNGKLIFVDVINMHGLNQKYGYFEVDYRISQSVKPFKNRCYRYYSGDEFIIVNTNISIIKASFANYGLSVRYSKIDYNTLISGKLHCVAITSRD